MKDDIIFVADRLRISGPLVDGGFRISLDVGEYMADRVADLVKLPQQVPLEVTVGLYQRSRGWDGLPPLNGIEGNPDIRQSDNPETQQAEKPDCASTGATL